MKKTMLLLMLLLLSVSANANNIEDTRRSCVAGDARDCKIMGDLTRAGLGVEQDDIKAYNYYDRACFDGDKDACKEMESMKKAKE